MSSQPNAAAMSANSSGVPVLTQVALSCEPAVPTSRLRVKASWPIASAPDSWIE